MDEDQDGAAHENEERTTKGGKQRRGGSAGGAGNGHAGDDGRAQGNTRRTVDGEHFALDFNGAGLRSIYDGGCMTWFVGPDACSMLAIENARDAIAGLDDDERAYANIQTPAGPRLMNVVSESGLYRLIIASKKTEAKAFRQWLFGEVLPSIRRTGGYQMGGNHARPDGQRGLAVSIPDPRAGSVYVVTIRSDLSTHVRRTDLPAVFTEAVALNAQIMAGALTMIAAYWHKTQLVKSLEVIRDDEDLAGLERTILHGNQLARVFLHTARLAAEDFGPAPRPPGQAH